MRIAFLQSRARKEAVPYGVSESLPDGHSCDRNRGVVSETMHSPFGRRR